MAQDAKIVILEGRLSFAIVSSKPTDTAKQHFYSVEEDAAYVHSFCKLTDQKLKEYTRKEVVFYTSPHEHLKANAAVLMGAYVVIRHGFRPVDILRLFIKLRFIPFRDASYGICGFMLSYLDCVRGIEHAIKCKLYDFNTFNLGQYLHLHQLQNGDINWIWPNKFLAFSGPYDERRRIGPNMFAFGVDDYVPVFKRLGVTCVVRLNKKCYDKRRFTQHGIKVKELMYEDGSCPPPAILRKFLMLANKEPCLAVHCKAGLGRTGTCIAVYMMKYLGFTARAIIAWSRICRPGSLLGPQQLYLERHEDEFLAEYANRQAILNQPKTPRIKVKTPRGKPRTPRSTDTARSVPGNVEFASSGTSDAMSKSKSPINNMKGQTGILPAFEDKDVPTTKNGVKTRPTSKPIRKCFSNLKSKPSPIQSTSKTELRAQSNSVLVPISNTSNNQF